MNNAITKPNFMRRFTAAVYDGFLLFAVLFAAAAFYAWLQDLYYGANQTTLTTGDVIHELQPIAQGWLYNCYLMSVIIIFYTSFWCKSGQTLGMQAWRIKVQRLDGEIMTIRQGAMRAFIGLLCVGVGMLPILFTKQRWAIYDKLTRTEVVLLPKPSK